MPSPSSRGCGPRYPPAVGPPGERREPEQPAVAHGEDLTVEHGARGTEILGHLLLKRAVEGRGEKERPVDPSLRDGVALNSVAAEWHSAVLVGPSLRDGLSGATPVGPSLRDGQIRRPVTP